MNTRITYVKARGEKPFNWNRFLARKRYTAKALDKAIDLAGEWVTCACGNQCAIIPRYSDGTPIDGCLGDLGFCFMHDIVDMRELQGSKFIESARKDALRTLQRIESRSAILIKRELKRKS